MKYKFPNGKTIELDDQHKNLAERYGGKPVKEEPKKQTNKK